MPLRGTTPVLRRGADGTAQPVSRTHLMVAEDPLCLPVRAPWYPVTLPPPLYLSLGLRLDSHAGSLSPAARQVLDTRDSAAVSWKLPYSLAHGIRAWCPAVLFPAAC
jgi:hypothetical protein